MKQSVEKRKPNGIVDHIALAMTTWGVGYIPGVPGTYGSAIGVAIYVVLSQNIPQLVAKGSSHILGFDLVVTATILVSLLTFVLIGIWASNRSISLLGSGDPSEAVVDEVMGQLITLSFIPFTYDWKPILAGFLLFRFFDIVKPYPARSLESLPGGLGICADDIVAGVYAGVCLAIGYAIYIPYSL